MLQGNYSYIEKEFSKTYSNVRSAKEAKRIIDPVNDNFTLHEFTVGWLLVRLLGQLIKGYSFNQSCKNIRLSSTGGKYSTVIKQRLLKYNYIQSTTNKPGVSKYIVTDEGKLLHDSWAKGLYETGKQMLKTKY